MAKFKVGDKVRASTRLGDGDSEESIPKGTKGVVMHVKDRSQNYQCPYDVLFTGYSLWYVSEDEIKKRFF